MSVRKPFPRSCIVDEHPLIREETQVARSEMFSHRNRQIFFGFFLLFLLFFFFSRFRSFWEMLWRPRCRGWSGRTGYQGMRVNKRTTVINAIQSCRVRRRDLGRSSVCAKSCAEIVVIATGNFCGQAATSKSQTVTTWSMNIVP